MKSPNVDVNCVQLVTSIGSFNGPFAANPTNAATAVPTASIGLDPEETSSMYTPGERYVGMGCLLLASGRSPPGSWSAPRLHTVHRATARAADPAQTGGPLDAAVSRGRPTH